jgi:hypothetical protein
MVESWLHTKNRFTTGKETTIVVAMIVILYTGRRWFVTVGWERNGKLGGHPWEDGGSLLSCLVVATLRKIPRSISRRQRLLYMWAARCDGMSLDHQCHEETFGVLGLSNSVQFASMHCDKVNCLIAIMLCRVNGVCQNSCQVSPINLATACSF